MQLRLQRADRSNPQQHQQWDHPDHERCYVTPATKPVSWVPTVSSSDQPLRRGVQAPAGMAGAAAADWPGAYALLRCTLLHGPRMPCSTRNGPLTLLKGFQNPTKTVPFRASGRGMFDLVRTARSMSRAQQTVEHASSPRTHWWPSPWATSLRTRW